MDSLPFIGRPYETERLNDLLKKKIASLVVIKGRRRIGKSRLVEEFARNKTFYTFSGLAPTPETTAQSQRNEFARQFGEQFKLPGIRANDWGDLFALLAKYTATGQVIILLDEITWMGSKDPDFLGKLKIAWDLYFKKNSQLILILCGSISSWIEKNIISSTGFFGRISLIITLPELTLNECNLFLEKEGFKKSALEKFMLLAVTGGIPWYLEIINPKAPVSENIKNLCFTPDGLLVDEFKKIFHDLFGRRGSIYQEIVKYLAKHPAEYSELTKALNYPSGGPLSQYLDDLIMSSFVSRDFTWRFQSGQETAVSKFRLHDNYLRFYLRYIAPNLSKIKKGQYLDMSITSLPAFESMMGLQFENIVLNNRKLIQQALKIRPEEIVADNPYFQRQTARQKGCQIDYLIQTKFNTLFVCEIKFSKNPIGAECITSVQEKIQHLKKPKGFSCVPILIHVNGVTEELENKEYFTHIIDFTKFLENP